MARSSSPSLAGLCIVTIVRFLDESMVPSHCPTLYEPHHYYPQEVNPFSRFPPGIVEQLVNELYKITEPTQMLPDKRRGISWKLRPLLLSGRIENLTVYIMDNLVDTLNILTMILGIADKLKSLRLDTYYRLITNRGFDCAVTDKVNLLLPAAVNLECLYTGVMFDFHKLEKLKKLHTLKFTKPLKRAVFMFKFLVFEDQQNRISHGTAFLLQNLLQLRSVNWDFTNSLEIIHREERISEISKTYELRKAYLLAPSEKQVDIFVRTCPYVEKLTIVLDKLQRMEHYSSLIKMNVTRVTIEVKQKSLYCSNDTEYQYWIPQIRQEISMSKLASLLFCLKGDLLKVLKLKYCIDDPDVQLLSSLFPNLQVLHLRLYCGMQQSKPLQTCFPQLKQAYLEFSDYCDPDYHNVDNLILLTSSPALQTLYLGGAFA